MFKIILTEIFVLIFSWSLLAIQEGESFELDNQELNAAARQNDDNKIKFILSSLANKDDFFVISQVNKAAELTQDENCLNLLYHVKSDSEIRYLGQMITEIEKHLLIGGKKCPNEIMAIITEYFVSYSITWDRIDSLFKRKRSKPLTETMDSSVRLGKEIHFIKALRKSDFLNADKILDEGPINFNFKDEHASLLHVASSIGASGIVQKLIENRAAVDSFNDEGETSLMLASANARLNVVKVLLESNANPSICDAQGRDSMDRTICKGILELLNAHKHQAQENQTKKSKVAHGH